MSIERLGRWLVMATVTAAAGGGFLAAQTTTSLGTARLPRAVVADGTTLPAGTYALRVSSEAVTPVVGQAPDGARWVEFVQGGVVKGRELATVIGPADVKTVAKGTPPPEGTIRVQMLRGADYLRLWANHDGTQYLVHLSVNATK
jgi:hypothetical protein